jgi:hypothetical protein
MLSVYMKLLKKTALKTYGTQIAGIFKVSPCTLIFECFMEKKLIYAHNKNKSLTYILYEK